MRGYAGETAGSVLGAAGLDRLHQDLDALDLGDADLLACGDHSALSGAAGAPYLPGDVHQAVTGQVVDLLRDQAGGTNDPVGVGGGGPAAWTGRRGR